MAVLKQFPFFKPINESHSESNNNKAEDSVAGTKEGGRRENNTKHIMMNGAIREKGRKVDIVGVS